MKKTLVFLFAFVVLGASATSEQRHKIAPENFDGAKLMQRYSLKVDDFHAEYVNGEMYIVIHDGVTIPSTPTFEASDTTKRARLSALRATARTQTLTLDEVTEYLRLRDGL